MKFKSRLEDEMQGSRFKTRIIIAQMFLMVVMAVGWSAVPTQMTVHYPPDLRAGAIKGMNEIGDAEVYLFADYILQQLNNWKTNGERDYRTKIRQLNAYITPNYRAYLNREYKAKKDQGELRKRTRIWKPIGEMYSEKKVKPLGKNWLVWIDVNIQEHINGGRVKNLKLRIPMKVVRYDVDRESNPWGLALNGPGEFSPKKITN